MKFLYERHHYVEAAAVTTQSQAANAKKRLVVIGNGMAPGRTLEKLFELSARCL